MIYFYTGSPRFNENRKKKDSRFLSKLTIGAETRSATNGRMMRRKNCRINHVHHLRKGKLCLSTRELFPQRGRLTGREQREEHVRSTISTDGSSAVAGRRQPMRIQRMILSTARGSAIVRSLHQRTISSPVVDGFFRRWARRERR